MQYLNRKDAAKYLGISVQTMHSYASRGSGPKFEARNGGYWYHIDELDRHKGIVEENMRRRRKKFKKTPGEQISREKVVHDIVTHDAWTDSGLAKLSEARP